MCRSCNALWKIVEKGFRPLNDSDNYTNREEVEAQLNSVALHMIQQAVGEKDLPFIMKYTVAKDAWDELLKLYIGNESMRHNKYSTLKNQAEGFMTKRDEDHQDMYARLMTVSTAFRNVGAAHIDEKWVKEKYVEALWPYEAQDLKTLIGRHNYYDMSSHELMQHLQAFKVQGKNAQDALKRALVMDPEESLALVASTAEEESGHMTSLITDSPEDVKHEFSDHMAFAARTFWKNPSKAKEQNYQRNSTSSFKGTGVRSR